MIFLFPDLETLRIALTSGQVASEVAVEPAEAAFGAGAEVSVKSHAIPPKAMQNALKRLGVKTAKAHMGEPIAVGCWPEILPVVKQAGVPELASNEPVLFDLPAESLADFAVEMLRLGNDRQGFRSFADGQRVLLRVIGPPYYTLLRALDRLHAGVVAYVEKSPRVWVEIGHAHPLAAKLKVPEGRLLLLRPPRQWTTLEDGPFQDIYEVLDFQLPAAAVAYAEGKLESKLTVPLRLAAGNAAEAPEMWVLRENAIEVFDAFVRDADDRLMGRLMFAVAENGEAGPTIILRVRQLAKMAPPTVDLTGAAGFTRYRKLNNLFVPAGRRLQPVLRRDAVRKMLADDDARIVWLTPLNDNNGRFVPESLADDAFRPLQDWVEYVIDREREALQSWAQATTFDFESFVCKGDLPDEPPPSALGKSKTRKPVNPDEPEGDEAPATPPAPKGKKKSTPKPGEEAFAAPVVAATPSEQIAKRDELEKAFLAIDGPLEAPERVALWPQLAQVNGALSDRSEAAICWLNALWERDDLPAAWMSVWFHSEVTSAGHGFAAADLDADLAIAAPTQSDLRQLASRLLYACASTPAPAALEKRLPKIRQYLENHDTNLGVRAVWLVWLHLAKISGDVLGLARVRDRLIERLFKNGLKRQYDVPTFIHFAGQRDSGRLRQVQDDLLRFRGEVHAWLDEQDKTKEPLHEKLTKTGWYADLLFAYGLGKLGEESRRLDLMSGALAKLRSGKSADPKQQHTPRFLANAFEFRIGQAAQGKEIGPLPSEILLALDGADPVLNYAANHLRKQLHILEPHEKSDPYLLYKKRTETSLNNDLAGLQPIADPKRLQSEIRRIFVNNGKPLNHEDQLSALIETVPLSIRAGREFALEMLEKVLPALTKQGTTAKGEPIYKELDLQAKLINASVPIAANYDFSELLQRILSQFVANLRALDEAAVIVSINGALGPWLRALRRCGLKDQLNAVLEELTGLLLRGRTLENLRHEYNREANRGNWVDMLRSLLHLAECWSYYGDQARALPFIDEARLFLFDNKNKASKTRPAANRYAPLVCAYIRALGQLNDFDQVVSRFSELLQKMDLIPNSQVPKQFYSGMHLAIVESLVLALVNEDFVLGETARRWLDDDEYLVRRRIHADMKKLLERSGL